MPDTKSNSHSERPGKQTRIIHPHLTRDEMGVRLAAPSNERLMFPFSREMIQRLIDRIKEK